MEEGELESAPSGSRRNLGPVQGQLGLKLWVLRAYISFKGLGI